jgi:hypothetical protein
MSYLAPNQTTYSYNGFDNLCKFLQQYLRASIFHSGSVLLNFSFLYRAFSTTLIKEIVPQLNEHFPAFHFTFANSNLQWERRNLAKMIRGMIVRQLQKHGCQKLVIDNYYRIDSVNHYLLADVGICQTIFDQLKKDYPCLELNDISERASVLNINWAIKPIYSASEVDLILAYFKLFVDEFIEYPTHKINFIQIFTHDLNVYLCNLQNRADIVHHFKERDPDFSFQFEQQNLSAPANLGWRFYVTQIEWEKYVTTIKKTSLSFNKHYYPGGFGHIVEYIDEQIYLAFKQKKAFGTITLPALLFRFGDVDTYQLSRLAQTRYHAFGMQVVNAHTLQWRWLSIQEWTALTPAINRYPEECVLQTHGKCLHSKAECYVMATLRPFAQLTNPAEPGEAVFFEFAPEITSSLSKHPDLLDRVRSHFEQKYPHRYFTWRRKGYHAYNAAHHVVTWQFYSTPILKDAFNLTANESEQYINYCASLHAELSNANNYLPVGMNPCQMAKTSFPSNEPDAEKNAALLQILIFIYAYMKFFHKPSAQKIVLSRSASYLLNTSLLEELRNANYARLKIMLREYCDLATVPLASIDIKAEDDKHIDLCWLLN